MEVVPVAGSEAEARVVLRRSLEEDQRYAAFREQIQAPARQGGANSPPLALGEDAKRAEHLHVNQPARCVEQVAGEQDMTGNGSVVRSGDK